MKKILFLCISALLISGAAVIGFAAHETGKGEMKGTITKIEIAEYEVTVKDDQGKETKARIKDSTGLKVGDSVIVKEGKVKKAVKPITGGY